MAEKRFCYFPIVIPIVIEKKLPAWEGNVLERKQKLFWNQWSSGINLGTCKIGCSEIHWNKNHPTVTSSLSRWNVILDLLEQDCIHVLSTTYSKCTIRSQFNHYQYLSSLVIKQQQDLIISVIVQAKRSRGKPTESWQKNKIIWSYHQRHKCRL